MYNKREKMHSTHIKCEICMRQLDYGQTVTNQVFVQFLMLQSLETGTRISITLCFTYGCTLYECCECGKLMQLKSNWSFSVLTWHAKIFFPKMCHLPLNLWRRYTYSLRAQSFTSLCSQCPNKIFFLE